MSIPHDDIGKNVLEKIRKLVGSEAVIRLVAMYVFMPYNAPINDNHWYF